MGSQSKLEGLFLPPGSFFVPKPGFYRCLPREPPWCAPIEWRIWLDLKISGISLCILEIGAPCNTPSWARKVLIGHHNRVPRSVPR